VIKRAFSSFKIEPKLKLKSTSAALCVCALFAWHGAPALALSDTGVEEAGQVESRLIPAAFKDAIEESTARPVRVRAATPALKAVSGGDSASAASAASNAATASNHGASDNSPAGKKLRAKHHDLHASRSELETASTEHHKHSGHIFSGLADYYHHSFYGHRTASGQTLQKHLLTAAHRTLPFGTRVKVQCKRSGRSCIVVINDRGPFTRSKVIDLSHEAARQIGLLQAGTAPVVCTVVPPDSED
jgi:rare lipoprotein A